MINRTISTDDTLREELQHGTRSYPFQYYPEDIWQFDFHCLDWHWHHELEFLTVTAGTALCLVSGDKIILPKGHGLFINSSILHRFEARSSTPIPNIVFSPTLLAAQDSLVYKKYVHPVITSAAPYQVFDPKTPWQNQILALLSQIYRLQESGKNNELHTLQLLFQLWDILFGHTKFSSPASPNIRRPNHRQAKLMIMMQYIHDHYQEPITLAEIAASASISKNSALHIFQTSIQTSPVAYLIRYRLTQAAKQLYTTEKSVSSIAEETGFMSAGYFCRKFKEYYQISPAMYRKKKAGQNSFTPPPS